MAADPQRMDVVVIGGGTAGLVTAAGVAILGGRVALVERAHMGGDCLNTGCVPSKALIAAARAAHQARALSRWGMAAGDVEASLGEVLARVRERRARVAPHDSRERFEKLGVQVVSGRARFVSPGEVAVDGRRFRARHFVVATGSRPTLPSVPGLAEAEPYTSETFWDRLQGSPRHAVVLGGGPIGCELGQAMARLGLQVTIIEVAPRILLKEDADVAAVIARALAREGVRLLTNAKVLGVVRNGDVTRIEVDQEGRRHTVEADLLLVAAGRAPNVEDLGLEEAGVAFDRKGIAVDAHLRTSRPHVFAAGDVVAGAPQFTHLAEHHGRVVVRNVLLPWWKAKVDTRVLPWVTYTAPEVGRVGLSEEEAGKGGIEVDVWRFPVEDLDRAIVEAEEDGFVKVLTRKGGDQILGAAVVAERGGEVVHAIALAMRTGSGLASLAGMIHAYPTWSELARRAADAYQRGRLTPLARRGTGTLLRRGR